MSPFRVKAVYDYASPHDDDLSFPNGQVITVTDEEDVDWYFGEYVGLDGSKHQGLFPRNFVERYEPETPPRPLRSTRSKKEPEHVPDLQEPPEPDTSETAHEDAVKSSLQKSVVDEPPVAKVSNAPENQPDSQPPVRGSGAYNMSSNSNKHATKPSTSTFSKPKPPPVEDHAVVGSFRDRIAAFNKPAAPPVAPTKPTGLSQPGGLGFIKKPFVAPPPSKNAYVPPPREPPTQKIYRREEEMSLQTSSNPVDTNLSNLPPLSAAAADVDTEDQPKPTSLKERIALLQKQQMEQAARHVETAQKKEKPRRPPKKRTDSSQTGGTVESTADGQDLERLNEGDIGGDPPVQSGHELQSGARSSTRRRRSKDAIPATSPIVPSREPFSDGNDADQSGAGDTEDGDDVSTGRDEIGEKPRTKMPPLPQRGPNVLQEQHEATEKERDADEEEAEEDEEEEEDMDPEVKRRLEIRERMAKMSGGMGMAGMFGPSGGAPNLSSRRQKTSGSSAKESAPGENTTGHDSVTSRNPRMMALPGLQRVQSPEQESRPQEVSKEEVTTPTSIIQGRQPEEMSDIEDLKEEVIPVSQRSEEISVLPKSQGSRGVLYYSD